MADARYLLLDVFTDAAFGGNQLAVFPDAEGLSAAQMQALARELNLAESTFVTPASGEGRFNLRIFTPGAELPFAGHPTVGTAVALAHLGRVPPGAAEITLLEGIGPVRVALGAGEARLFMDGPPETRPHPHDAATIAACVGLEAADLAGPALQAGYGTAFLLVPVIDRGRVSRAAMQAERFAALGLWARGVFVYAREPNRPEIGIYARMFAPKLGVPEDPATGSAAAGLLGTADFGVGDGEAAVVIAQGVDMGRPSRILGRVTRRDGAVVGVSVGGGAVVVGEGRFTTLP